MREKIIVVTPHPDDETLGCGGYLLEKSKEHDIYWLIMTNIDEKQVFNSSYVAKRQEKIKFKPSVEDKGLYNFAPGYLAKRQEEIDKVASAFGFKEIFKLDFPTAALDQVPVKEIVSAISSVFDEVKPTVVFLPNRSDVHSDHKISFDAGYASTRNFRLPSIKKVYVYECLSETEFSSPDVNPFIPNTYLDITSRIEDKIRIFRYYESEVMSDPLPRSISTIYAHARYRGSRIGVQYAEAYRLILDIV